MKTFFLFPIRVCVTVLFLFLSLNTIAQIPKARFAIHSIPDTHQIVFTNLSEGDSLSLNWVLVGGYPSTSSDIEPIIEYLPGNYTATLNVENSYGVSSYSMDFIVSEGNLIDLCTGRNEDGTLMSVEKEYDYDWTYIHPDESSKTPQTRTTYTGWSHAQHPPIKDKKSVWISGRNTVTGYHYYISKSFTIPESVENAKLTLRSLSFVRNWTYLVRENEDGTETETEITKTTWMNDGAKGWVNSRSPLVDKMSIPSGTYHIKVKLYTSNSSVQQAIDVNAFVDYSVFHAGTTDFSSSLVSSMTNTPIAFNNLSSGSPVSYIWKFKNSSDEISSSDANPIIYFNEEGFYDVELTTTYADGLSSTLKMENYIEITGNNVDYSLAPNSYIFDPYQDEYDGLYLPVKKAYDIWAAQDGFLDEPIVSGLLSASIVWQDVAGLVKPDPSTPSLDYNLPIVGEGENAKIKVLIDKSKGEGNAVIAFKVNDIVKWSWHIWVTDNPEVGASNTALESYNRNLNGDYFAPTFMDRNLGATHHHFLGNEWNKSGGLMYEWGRKDPFPPLVYKDYTFYEVEGEVGIVKHKYSLSSNTTTMDDFTVLRPDNNIDVNIRYSIENPFHYIYTSNNSNWFSSANNLGSIPGDTAFNQMFDLWGDNFGGKRGGYLPYQTSQYEPYPLKSTFDPCPKGWRVPSHNGQATGASVFSVWGRGGNGEDDVSYSIIQPNVNNIRVSGVKVYPGLGIDFSEVTNRTIGTYSLTGGFKQYGTGKPYFQDPFSESHLWTATTYNNSGRSMLLVSDYARSDVSSYGLHSFHHTSSNATQTTQKAQAVKCIVDPNDSLLPDFSTEFIIADISKRNYKTGLYNPNSYIVDNNQENLEIPISKGFAIYNQFLTDREWPSGTLGAKVVWTTNTSLITKVYLENALINDPDNGVVKIEFGENDPKGNAVIALTVNDEVLWSWHIWAPNDDPTSNPIIYTNEDAITTLNLVNSTKSGVAPLTTTFMDRNLGAIEAFPEVSNPGSLTPSEVSQIENSGGLHYQWGRKDPIPSFLNVNSGSYLIYLETMKDSYGNSIYGATVNSSDYLSNFTSSYPVYGASSSANRNEKILQSLDYSIKNPLNFLYHTGNGNPDNYSQIKDWIADERNLADNRWGHADKKSPFDPCPNGWRVPDVSFTFLESNTIQLGSTIYSGAIGTSPWYRNKILSGSGAEQNRHLIQKNAYEIGPNYYEGEWIQGYGWMLNNNSYKIGNFPNTGIRGYVGENIISNSISGVWTSSMSDLQLGYAIGLFLGVNSSNTKGIIKSGGGFYPQAGMNVRCALDEPRYNGIDSSNKKGSFKEDDGSVLNKEIELTKASNDYFIYPNPVKDILYINTNEYSNFVIYNIGGVIVKSGKFENSKINLKDLPKGVYIIKILKNNSESEIIKKFIKD